MGKLRQTTTWLLIAAAAAALSAAPDAQAARFGFADDEGKYADDGGTAFFDDLKAAGGTENRITVRWDPKRPEAILEESFLDRVDAGGDGERDPRRLPRLPDQPDVAHLVPRSRPRTSPRS